MGIVKYNALTCYQINRNGHNRSMMITVYFDNEKASDDEILELADKKIKLYGGNIFFTIKGKGSVIKKNYIPKISGYYFRVYALLNDNWYGLFHTEYSGDRSDRIELILNNLESTVFEEEEDAFEAIKTHKRSKLDEKVEEYKIVKV